MLSPGEVLRLKMPLPHLPTGFVRISLVYGVDVSIYPHLPHLPDIIRSKGY